MQIYSCSHRFFSMTREIRQRELSNCRIKDGVLLNFLLLLVDYLPMAAFIWADATDSTI